MPKVVEHKWYNERIPLYSAENDKCKTEIDKILEYNELKKHWSVELAYPLKTEVPKKLPGVIGIFTSRWIVYNKTGKWCIPWSELINIEAKTKNKFYNYEVYKTDSTACFRGLTSAVWNVKKRDIYDVRMAYSPNIPLTFADVMRWIKLGLDSNIITPAHNLKVYKTKNDDSYGKCKWKCPPQIKRNPAVFDIAVGNEIGPKTYAALCFIRDMSERPNWVIRVMKEVAPLFKDFLAAYAFSQHIQPTGGGHHWFQSPSHCHNVEMDKLTDNDRLCYYHNNYTNNKDFLFWTLRNKQDMYQNICTATMLIHGDIYTYLTDYYERNPSRGRGITIIPNKDILNRGTADNPITGYTQFSIKSTVIPSIANVTLRKYSVKFKNWMDLFGNDLYKVTPKLLDALRNVDIRKEWF